MIAFTCAAILAGRAPTDTPVTVKGWVRTRRDSKAGISFVNVSDGSCFNPVQVVAPNTLANYNDEVVRLTAGCAVEATGTIVPSPAKGQPFEMQASALRVIGWVEDPDTYPIQPKPHTLEFLREEHAHRRLGFTEAEIADWCRAAGLDPAPARQLPGDPLTVVIWTAWRREPAIQAPSRSRHAAILTAPTEEALPG